ncbi:MAG: hypothetical protein AAF304_04380 [Pseudomonadota bacterium]
MTANDPKRTFTGMELFRFSIVIILSIIMSSYAYAEQNAALNELKDFYSMSVKYADVEHEDKGKTICFKDEILIEPIFESTYLFDKYKGDPNYRRVVFNTDFSPKTQFKDILRMQPGTSVRFMKAFDQIVHKNLDDNKRTYRYIETSNDKHKIVFHRSDYFQLEKYECQENIRQYEIGKKGPVYALDEKGNLIPKYNYDGEGNLIPIE